MTAYLDLTAFQARSVMPASMINEIETQQTGWVAQQLASQSALIDARLAKRYLTPFASPYPEAVLNWLARVTTVRCFLRVGVAPTDQQFQTIKDDADSAWAEIKEAADSETGLFDLPLRADLTQTGISQGGPFSYSEASPYVWTDIQGDQARFEDQGRGGTYGGR